MCWGVIAKVVEADCLKAKVDFGGSLKEVLVVEEDVKVGDLVVVHAGTIIGKIDEREVKDTLKLYKSLK